VISAAIRRDRPRIPSKQQGKINNPRENNLRGNPPEKKEISRIQGKILGEGMEEEAEEVEEQEEEGSGVRIYVCYF
jgi:hypothetical protein